MSIHQRMLTADDTDAMLDDLDTHFAEEDPFRETRAHEERMRRMAGEAAATEEARALGAIGYQPNEITLHADPRAMPRRRGCWSSWNYTEGRSARDGKIDLTYWMNKLQPIPANDPMFVTLNARKPIRDELIYDQVTLRHPVYDQAALRAQGEVAGFNGARRTWFCGAWMRNGFHEDGLASAADVADRILARPDVMVAAE